MTIVKSQQGVQSTSKLFLSSAHSPSFASLTNHFEQADQLQDYCIPVNSYFPTPAIMQALYAKIPYALKYYPGSNEAITKLICEFADIADPATVIAGNGSTELISWLNTLYIQDDVLVPVPSFGRWTDEPKGLGRTVHVLAYDEARDQELTVEAFVEAVNRSGTRNAVLCNPNNPTGSIMSRQDVIWIMERLTHLDTLVIDESFIDFSFPEPPTVKDVVAQFPNAWVLKSMGKNVGLHGLRMGYAVSHPANIERLKKHLPFWNVNGVTELLLTLLRDQKAIYEQSRLQVIADREYLLSELAGIKELRVFPSYGNFAFVRLDDAFDGDMLRNRLLAKQQCLVRNCGNKVGSNSQYFRLAARPQQQTDLLISALRAELAALKKERFLASIQEMGCQIIHFPQPAEMVCADREVNPLGRQTQVVLK